MNKKTSLYLYILIAVFTVFVGASTYAFFAGNNNIDAKANLSAETGKTYTFTSTSATNFELNLTSADMQQSQSGNYVSSSLEGNWNGLINFGNNTILAAAESSSITRVSTVDEKVVNILCGFVVTRTTIISGE